MQMEIVHPKLSQWNSQPLPSEDSIPAAQPDPSGPEDSFSGPEDFFGEDADEEELEEEKPFVKDKCEDEPAEDEADGDEIVFGGWLLLDRGAGSEG